jgi:hypothetical protein
MWKSLSQTPVYKSWLGYAFESLCLKHIYQIKKGLQIGGIYSEAVSFTFAGNDELPGTQIDLLIDRNDSVINLCELKFYDEPFTISKSYAEQLARKRRIFKTVSKTKKQVFITLVTTYGLQANPHSLGLVDSALDLNALFD